MDNNDNANYDTADFDKQDENTTANNEQGGTGQIDVDDIPVDLTDDEVINLFVEGLIEMKGLKSDSEELRKDIFSDLKTRLLEEIDRSLVAELPDNKLEELSKEAAANGGKLDPEVVAKAVEEAKINVEEVIGATMAKFKDIYLGEDKKQDADNSELDNTGAEEGEDK